MSGKPPRMTFTDRVVATFSPRRAYMRMQFREALARYEAATKPRKGRGYRDNSTGEAQVVRDAATCRAIARDLERNHDIFRGALNALVRNVVGPNGISIEPQPRKADDTIDDDFARDLINAHREWCAKPEVTQTMTWIEAQQLAGRTWLRDGEVFGQMVEGYAAPYAFPGEVPFALELLEPDVCPIDYANDTPTIDGGIERNAWGQPLAYYFYKFHPGNGRGFVTFSETALKRVPAARILHLAIRDRLSGLRGISQFASAITRLDDIKDYEESERIAARIAAAIAAYVKRDVNMTDFVAPQEQMGADGKPVQRKFEIEAGAIFDQTLPGEELQMLNANRPNTGLEAFRQGQLRAAAAGIGTTYSTISRDYNGTYSSQRQELVEGWDDYRILSSRFIFRFVLPTWERFVAMAVLSGRVKVPAGIRPETIAQAAYRGPKMPWIDPYKEAVAARTLVRAGFESDQNIIAERGGRLQDVYEQIARARKLAEEMGLVFDSDAKLTSAAGLTQARPGGTSLPDLADGAPASDETNNSAEVITMPKRSPIAAAVRANLRHAQGMPTIPSVISLKPSAAAGEYELLIYGDIGDSWWGDSVTAASVVQQLIALDDSVTQINVRINSYGGSVSDGLAIYNALKRHKATKAVTVDGVAMSIASLIAMAGDTVQMPPESIFMIHAPWSGVVGNAKDMREFANVLDTYADAMAQAYVKKSGKARADVLTLLQDGQDHYYTGTQAVEEGFADETIDPNADEPDDQARAFASGLLQRYATSIASAAPATANLVIAAALRGRVPKGSVPTPAAAPPATARPGFQSALEIIFQTSASTESEKVIARLHEALSAQLKNSADPPTTPAAPAASTKPEELEMPDKTPEAIAQERKAVLAADKQRRDSIRNRFAPFMTRDDLDQKKLNALLQECEDDHDCTPEAAGIKLLDRLGSTTEPLSKGQGRVEPGNQDETKNYREGAVQAVLHRSNPSAHKLDERSQGFRGFTLVDLARDCVERTGVRTRGLSRNEIAVKALSTSDFPNILENIITKTLRAGYAGSQRTFVPFSRQATLPDFKQISRAQLGGAPNLLRVLEGAEYEYGSIGDGAEKYAVQKYGRIVGITWETIINDDLDALTRVPQAFGASAADLESDIVYALINANANMADGVALFNATHGNVGTGAPLANALDPTLPNPLAEMRKLMLLQKGIEGRYITVRPKFLIVPPDLEETALRVTNATVLPNKNIDVNVVGPTLTPIVEPRLHDASATAWYGAADPSTVDTVEFAYLEGNEGVFTETRNGFEVDGLQVKCRHVFGAKAIDWRGLFKNAGA